MRLEKQEVFRMKIRRGICLLIVASCVAIAGCGGRAYVYQPLPEKDLRARAETMVDGSVRVTAAVPGREETAAIFGVDLYEQGIQPVWLEIGNSGDSQVRYAPVSTDRYYYSPLEVAYKNRGGISDQGRLDMERRFDDLAMPRYVDPGESRAGFVFTQWRAPGTRFTLTPFIPKEG